MNIIRRPLAILCIMLSSLLVVTIVAPLARAAEATEARRFSLQVSPSPLVATLKPGVTTELELKIRNASTAKESLKIEARSFKITGEKVSLDDTAPADVAQWVSFAAPTFTVAPSQWYTQKVRISLPKEAGFSYSFALVISRTSEPKATGGGNVLRGSVAVFTLVNVDRPGAKRQLETVSLKTSRGVYEYLPAELSVKLKNTGNTIVQPYGNIFIQRGSQDTKPLATLPVNETKGYILPGNERTLSTSWSKGFPLTKITTSAGGKESKTTAWNWKDISDFRIGRYTAKLVAVYNDGVRDVPIQGEVTFWVLPWKIILGGIVILTLTLFGLWSVFKRGLYLMQSPKSHTRK